MSRSPLAGKTVLVTRPADRARRLVKQLDQRGARALAAPAIELRPVRSAALTAALKDLAAGRFAWLVLTSPATVAMLADRLAGAEDVRARVAAIGDGTADTYGRWSGRVADLRPRAFTTEALARSFPRGGGRVLCARADIAPEGLEDALAAKGWTPTRVDAYRTVFPDRRCRPSRERHWRRARWTPSRSRAPRPCGGSSARWAPSAARRRSSSSGPITAKEARAHGFVVHAVADPHTTDGLISALERVFAPRR